MTTKTINHNKKNPVNINSKTISTTKQRTWSTESSPVLSLERVRGLVVRTKPRLSC